MYISKYYLLICSALRRINFIRRSYGHCRSCYTGAIHWSRVNPDQLKIGYWSSNELLLLDKREGTRDIARNVTCPIRQNRVVIGLRTIRHEAIALNNVDWFSIFTKKFVIEDTKKGFSWIEYENYILAVSLLFTDQSTFKSCHFSLTWKLQIPHIKCQLGSSLESYLNNDQYNRSTNLVITRLHTTWHWHMTLTC